MPVRNAERYLAEAIDSLLAQDYPNFELVISDNGSTDSTEKICRDYARRDERVVYHRSDENHGAVWNFNRVFQLGRGQYFAWAAHDDLRAPPFLSRCVAALEARPDAGMCCAEVALIDNDGRRVDPWATIIHPVGESVRGRVRAIGLSRYWVDLYGVMRVEALRRTSLARPVWGYDVSIMLQIALLGAVLFVPEALFLYRVDPSKTVEQVASTLGTETHQGAIPANWSALTLELLGDVWRSGLALPVRLGLLLQLWFDLCVLNGLVGPGILHDVRPNLAAAWAQRHGDRFVALLAIALPALPVHNRLSRSLLHRLRPAGPTRARIATP